MKWLYHEGRLEPGDVPRVPTDARGLLLGDGVFETLRVYAGVVFRLDAHLGRLRASLEAMAMAPALADDVPTRVAHAVALAGGGDLRVRVTAVRAGRAPGPAPSSTLGEVFVHLDPLTHDPSGVPVRLASAPSPLASTPFRTIKSTSYAPLVVALAAARARGADDALFVDADGAVVECATANVFARVDGTLVTPPLSRRLLAGITRAEAIAIAAGLGDTVVERDLTLVDVFRASEVFVTSTLREIAPVTTLDDRPLPPAPTALRLREAFRGRVGR